MNYQEIQRELIKLGNPQIAKHTQRFFKTAKGEYGYGDIFLGIRVPIIRKHVQKYRDISIEICIKLLKSKYHEIRLFALLAMVSKYSKGSYIQKQNIFNLYLENTKHINNWDLIDTSAHHIVGNYLTNKDKSILIKLARSKSLWERRIAIIATFEFIKNYNFNPTLEIAEMLICDQEDLIHKAVGWMLREIGKKDLSTEIEFLNKHYQKMPRTMLRYAIEKFPEIERQKYLDKTYY